MFVPTAEIARAHHTALLREAQQLQTGRRLARAHRHGRRAERVAREARTTIARSL